jgi:hypothetical protein
MKLLISTIFYSILLIALPACGITESFQEMSEQTKVASAVIENEIGNRPFIGWTINNGNLTEINIYFKDLDEDLTISEIKQVVRSSVDNHIENKPKSLLVTINISD